MTAASRITPREELEPVSARGRAAGLTTGACALLAGFWLMFSSWTALTCPLGGARGRAICSHTTGIGGLMSLFAIGLSIAGAGILWRTGRRLVIPDGPSGWMWGEGVAIVAGGLTIALTIPTFHCPAGYELTTVFHACRSAIRVPELIVHAPTWLAWKFGVAAASVVVGVVVARWRRLPWPVASAVTSIVVASAAWYLAERTVGLATL